MKTYTLYRKTRSERISGSWVNNMECPKGVYHSAFDGNLSYSLEYSESSCALICELDARCMYANLFYNSSFQSCALVEGSGKAVTGLLAKSDKLCRPSDYQTTIVGPEHAIYRKGLKQSIKCNKMNHGYICKYDLMIRELRTIGKVDTADQCAQICEAQEIPLCCEWDSFSKECKIQESKPSIEKVHKRVKDFMATICSKVNAEHIPHERINVPGIQLTLGDDIFNTDWNVSINFQPRNMQVPNGFLPDYGDVFGDRAHGLRYGWTCDISHDANDLKNWGTALSSQIIPDRFDKCYLPVEWEIELPNQKYSVEIGYANYGRYLVTYGCAVEGQSAEAGSNHDGLPLKTTVQVHVKDNYLSFSGSFMKECTSINYIIIKNSEIERQEYWSDTEIILIMTVFFVISLSVFLTCCQLLCDCPKKRRNKRSAFLLMDPIHPNDCDLPSYENHWREVKLGRTESQLSDPTYDPPAYDLVVGALAE